MTNGSASYQMKKVQGSGLDKLVQAIVISGQLGIRKADRRIFMQGLAAMRTDPAASLFVGDDPDADIVGAKAVGMRTVWLNRAADGPTNTSLLTTSWHTSLKCATLYWASNSYSRGPKDNPARTASHGCRRLLPYDVGSRMSKRAEALPRLNAERLAVVSSALRIGHQRVHCRHAQPITSQAHRPSE